MRLYYAGSEPKQSFETLVRLGVKSFLYSFYSTNGKPFHSYDKQYNVFLDSGGFVARTRGVEISVVDYADYIIKMGLNNLPNVVYANLDLMDTVGTLKNQEYLESRGLKPLPVYHFSELQAGNKELLKRYCEKHKYIAVGGVAAMGLSEAQKKYYLDFVFSITKDKIKVHGFGINDPKVLKEYPFYSADATSWLQGARYGIVTQFNSKEGKLKSFSKSKKISKHEYNNSKSLETIMASDYKLANVKNIMEYIKLEKYITDL